MLAAWATLSAMSVVMEMLLSILVPAVLRDDTPEAAVLLELPLLEPLVSTMSLSMPTTRSWT